MTDRQKEAPLPAALLGAWEVPGPTTGFADRVAARTRGHGPGYSRPRWSARRGTRIALGLAAAALLFALLRLSPPTGGHTATASRTTVQLGRRGVAVAEPGARLTWRVGWTGLARIDQREGEVFYRVEPGAAFEVRTPHGSVDVVGTCLTVDISRDTRVIVHEGEVSARTDAGQQALGAGEAARLSPGRRPARALVDTNDVPARAGAPHARAATPVPPPAAWFQGGTASRGDALDSAGAPVQDPEAPASAEQATACAKHGSCARDIWVDPTGEHLAELARCGRLLIDTPSFMGDDDTFDPRVVAEREFGWSESELAAVVEVGRRWHSDVGDQLGDLLAEMGVEHGLIDRLTPAQRLNTALAVVDPANAEEIRWRVARERAGVVAEPTVDETMDAQERALRLYYRLGRAYTQRLGAVIGDAEAAEVRRATAGWPMKASIGGGDCDEEGSAER